MEAAKKGVRELNTAVSKRETGRIECGTFPSGHSPSTKFLS